MFSKNTLRRIDAWNRKLHNYVGLFLLCFIWLFAVSGLILNHPTWKFTQFWPDRTQSSNEVAIDVPPPGEAITRAQNLMAQVGISGEIQRITAHTEEENPGFDIQVLKPGRITDIKANFRTRRATIEQIQTNSWGVIHWLHHFSGVRMDRPEMERDWALTALWSLAMDAVCVGLIFLVASSFYMWYPMLKKRKLGWTFLGAGTLSCSFFLFVLNGLF